MTRVDVRMVNALIVARLRELAGIRLRLSVATMTFAALAFLPAPDLLLLLTATEAGVISGVFATGRLTRQWLDTYQAHPTSLRQELVPALPVTLLTRAAATTPIAIALAVPYLWAAMMSGYLRHRLLPVLMISLGGVVLGIFVNLAWIRLVRGRLRLAIARIDGRLHIPAPKYLSETNAVFWAALPKTLLWTLITTSVGVALATYMVFGEHGVHLRPHELRMMRVIICLPAYGTMVSALWNMHAPLSVLAVSRRAVTGAELRLALLSSALTSIVALAALHVVGHDLRLTRAVAHLFVTVCCLTAAARVANVRIASSSNLKPTLLASMMGAALAPLGTSLVSFYATQKILDTISVIAFLLAVLLAYTAPNTPLSTSPFRTDLFTFLQRSSATPRGK